jgi:hypothetical protein
VEHSKTPENALEGVVFWRTAGEKLADCWAILDAVATHGECNPEGTVASRFLKQIRPWRDFSDNFFPKIEIRATVTWS